MGTATSPHTPLSTVLSPPETAAGTRQEHDATGQLEPRVVVERLDSLGQGAGLDGGVCGVVGALPEAAAAHQPLTLSFALSASSLEEETYPPVGLSLNTDIGFDLGDTLNTTTTTTTTGNILDGFLADTEMMAMADSEKCEKSLDDLFPDLDLGAAIFASTLPSVLNRAAPSC